MIKSLSLMTSMGKEKFSVVVKWRDPANLLDWKELATRLEGAMTRFQTRMRLKPAQGFSLEEFPQFLIKDQLLGACHVQVVDLNRGAGIEVDLPPDNPSG